MPPLFGFTRYTSKGQSFDGNGMTPAKDVESFDGNGKGPANEVTSCDGNGMKPAKVSRLTETE